MLEALLGRDDLNAVDDNGDTALHIVLDQLYVSLGALDWAILRGANVHAVDANGKTPLSRFLTRVRAHALRHAARSIWSGANCRIMLADRSDCKGNYRHGYTRNQG